MVAKDSRREFDFLISWLLWRERNDRIFNEACNLVTQLAQNVAEVGLQWIVVSFVPLSDVLQ
jgi:hypothetical protein